VGEQHLARVEQFVRLLERFRAGDPPSLLPGEHIGQFPSPDGEFAMRFTTTGRAVRLCLLAGR
jgi:hypothetical protein